MDEIKNLENDIQTELKKLVGDGWQIEIQASPASVQFGSNTFPPGGPDIVIATKKGQSTGVHRKGTPGEIAKQLVARIKEAGWT